MQVTCTAHKPVQLDAPGGREVPSATRGGDLFITNFLDAPATAYLLLRQVHGCMSCKPGACACQSSSGVRCGFFYIYGTISRASANVPSASV